MEWIFNQLRERPELAIFLTIFLGFWLGKLRIGKFTLGTVTSVLLVGVLVGQLNIAVPGPIKSVFFLLFGLDGLHVTCQVAHEGRLAVSNYLYFMVLVIERYCL